MDNAQVGVDLLRPYAPFGRGASVPLRVTKGLSEKEGGGKGGSQKPRVSPLPYPNAPRMPHGAANAAKEGAALTLAPLCAAV
jgi:hypothetical protein